MIRLTILLFLLSMFCTSCSEVQKKEKLMRPNILFIAVDDLRPELGCYGNKIVKTPNLDKLGSEGVIFKNHFVQVPTCGASRYSLITGMRPRNKMQLQNNVVELEISNNKENKKRPESFIHHLRINGYYTLGIGKITHSPDGLIYGYKEKPSNKRELPYSWDELVFDSGIWGTGWNAFFGFANGENRQSLKSLVKPYEMAEVNDEGYPDGLTANLAIAKLKELKQKSQPFFMGVGFFKPHLPFNAPKKYWDLYDRDSIPVALNQTIPENINEKSLHNSNEFNQYKLTDETLNLNQKATEEYAKKLKHAYYASVSYIDHQIGELLDELDLLGLKENTIIVVWGDHGWHLGEQQVWGKHTLFDNALKSPLIIIAPQFKGLRGKEINAVIETVDIYPSILELCNIDMPYLIDGNSFINLFEDKEDLQDEVAFSYYNNGISMRTNRYRITKYFREEEPTIELYDHVHDPFETINIALEKPNIVDKLLPLLENMIFKF
jgi:arylsulfatase A-like enzyme